MPTDRTVNRGADLHRDEPPRSPPDLDRRIVQRARQKADEYNERSNTAGVTWLGAGWKTAVGVFSVAAIAVSVTLQVFDNSLERRFSSDVALESRESQNQTDVTLAEAPSLQDRDEPEQVTENLNQSAAPASTAIDVSVVVEPASSQNDLAPAVERRAERSLREVQSPQASVRAPAQDVEQALTDTAALASVASQTALAAGNVEDLQQILQQSLQQSRELRESQELRTNSNNSNPVTAGANSSAVGQSAASPVEDSRSRLAELLALLARVLDPIDAAAVAETETDAASDTEQLVSRTADLVAGYNAIEDRGQLARLETAFSQQREELDGLSLPLTLELTITLLERWLAEFQSAR